MRDQRASKEGTRRERPRSTSTPCCRRAGSSRHPRASSRGPFSDPSAYERAAQDPEAFWAEQAERLDWTRRWDTVMEWTPPFAKWFIGGT